MDISVEQVKVFYPEITNSINELLIELDPDSKRLSHDDVKSIIENSNNYLLVAKTSSDNKVAGMIALIAVNAPSGKKGLMEDFVVGKNNRGKGIGTKLINELITKAREVGMSHIDFTSTPQRAEANKLYQNLGFKKRETNVYRIIL
jgi:ribosomal protein S18 acetylase RimI-like enzyme